MGGTGGVGVASARSGRERRVAHHHPEVAPVTGHSGGDLPDRLVADGALRVLALHGRLNTSDGGATQAGCS